MLAVSSHWLAVAALFWPSNVLHEDGLLDVQWVDDVTRGLSGVQYTGSGDIGRSRDKRTEMELHRDL